MSTILKILRKLHLDALLDDDLTPLCLNGVDFLNFLDQGIIKNNLQGKELLLINKLLTRRPILLKMLLRDSKLILDEDEHVLIEFCKVLDCNFKNQFPKLSILKEHELKIKDKILNLSEVISKISINNKELSYKEILAQAIFERPCFNLNDQELTHILKTYNSKSFSAIRKNLDKFSLDQYLVYLAFLHQLSSKDKKALLNLLLERIRHAINFDKQEIKKGELQLIDIYTKASDVYHVQETDLGKWLYFMYTKGRKILSKTEQLWISDCYTSFLLKQNIDDIEDNRQKSILNFFTYLKIKQNITI